MSNAQKNYLKKWAIALGIIFSVALMIACLVIGNPWDMIASAIVCLGGLVLIAVMMAGIIGSMIWHWRLMGVCENDWEEHMLKYWWRFMNYWGGDWEELIAQMIAEDYEQDSEDYVLRMELYDKFRAVKAPRVLQW